MRFQGDGPAQTDERVLRELEKFPETFGLKDWPGKVFRTEPSKSYYSKDYGVQIIIQVDNGTKDAPLWQDFVRYDARPALLAVRPVRSL